MACYRLAQYPEVFHRLRQEVIETVGTGKPTYDDIRKMKYLRAVINGVLLRSHLLHTVQADK